ncbi:MAG: hypothetical protein HC933_09000 [Pleurocapsa sp. SU_196_0]|nr:hypothetical protein [Pleurocapsa sp. SU_196_0]
MRGIGKFAFGVYNRANEFEMTNSGLIENSLGRGGGVAIAGVPDAGRLATFEFENEEDGVVNGDIVLAGAHAQRWWLLSTGQGTGTAPSASASQGGEFAFVLFGMSWFMMQVAIIPMGSSVPRTRNHPALTMPCVTVTQA